MTDENKLLRDTNRAMQALSLVNNELLRQGFFTLEEAYIRAWRETAARDGDARERLWQAVQVVGKVRDHLTKIVQDGKIAQRELDDLTEKRKLFSRAR